MAIKQSRSKPIKFFNKTKHRDRSVNLKQHVAVSKCQDLKPISTSAFRNYDKFEATFIGQPDNISGFLRITSTKNCKDSDVLVDRNEGHAAVHGDHVEAEITGTTYNGRLKAKITKIISHSINPLPARLQKQASGWSAVPLEPRFTQIIALPSTDLAQDGDIVAITLDPISPTKQIRGMVTSRLGKYTDLNIENKLTAAIFNLRTEFPKSVMDEISTIPTVIPLDWLQGREDLRNQLIVTVDPPTAKDYDDAISITPLNNPQEKGWMLGVHITDVSHYVNEGGPVDQEARLRGTSIYFPDQCISMLPERLSGELCSLLEGVDRLAITVWITLNHDLKVVATRFTKSIINSRRRLTYDQVKEACLDQSEDMRKNLGTEVCNLLDEALKVSRNLTKIRMNRGALNLTCEETEFLFDVNKRPFDARRHVGHDIHRMIEEFMLLANEAVASFFANKKIPAIYRIHDEPDPVKFEIFREVASTLGLLKTYDKLTPNKINALLENIHGKPITASLNTLLIRSLKKAEYSTDNIGHSGLALIDYLHFTSPIRRYPDLAVHRLLSKVIHKSKLPDNLYDNLSILAKNCSRSEQTAVEAERDNHRWKTCIIMRNKIGSCFDGYIVGFSKKRAFIRINSPFLEVSVSLNAIMNKEFTTDTNNIKAYSQDGNIILAIGDKVVVMITEIDEGLRQVNASITKLLSKQSGSRVIGCPVLSANSKKVVNKKSYVTFHSKSKTKSYGKFRAK